MHTEGSSRLRHFLILCLYHPQTDSFSLSFLFLGCLQQHSSVFVVLKLINNYLLLMKNLFMQQNIFGNNKIFVLPKVKILKYLRAGISICGLETVDNKHSRWLTTSFWWIPHFCKLQWIYLKWPFELVLPLCLHEQVSALVNQRKRTNLG